MKYSVIERERKKIITYLAVLELIARTQRVRHRLREDERREAVVAAARGQVREREGKRERKERVQKRREATRRKEKARRKDNERERRREKGRQSVSALPQLLRHCRLQQLTNHSPSPSPHQNLQTFAAAARGRTLRFE